MARLRPGWLVVLCAAVLAVSVWLPWLTSRADGGGHANAIGGIIGSMPVPPPGFGVGQLIVLLTEPCPGLGRRGRVVLRRAAGSRRGDLPGFPAARHGIPCRTWGIGGR